MGNANEVLSPTGQAIPEQAITLEAALDNLALAASTDSDILQQLTVANLVLTTMNAMLMATKETLADLATKAQAAAYAGGTTAGTGRTTGGVKRIQSQTDTVGFTGIKSTATTQVKPDLPFRKVIAWRLRTTTP